MDLVRSYTTSTNSVVPHFLAVSFEMLRDGQSKMLENMGKMNPMAKMPGFEAMQAQQKAFFNAMTGGMGAWPQRPEPDQRPATGRELDEIKSQLAELQAKLARMNT